jgi:hypothetical protein
VLTNLAGWTNSCAQGSDMSPHINSTLDVATGWLVSLSASASYIGSGKGSAASMRRELEALNEDLARRATGLGDEISKAATTLTDMQQEVTATSAQLQSTRDENAAVVVSLRQQVDAEKAAVLQKVAADATARLDAIDASAATKLSDIDAGLASEVSQAEQILTGLRSLEKEVQSTAESVGDRVLTGDYGMYAAVERKSANLLRYGAIASLAAAAGFAVWAALAVSKGEITWQRLAAKLAVTVVFSGLASYLASQSREHREQERQARRRHLDLKALGPFIVDLPAELQQNIRNELALKAFLIEKAELAETKVPKKGVSIEQLKAIADVFATVKKL